MNWEAIGAISGLIGAAAVVVTLLYLAVETSKNARAIDASSASEIAGLNSSYHLELARDPELRRIVQSVLSQEPGEFSPEEWQSARALLVAWFMLLQAQFSYGRYRIGQAGDAERHVELAKAHIATYPVIGRFWDEELKRFRPFRSVRREFGRAFA